MFLQLNHLQGKSAAQTAQETVAAIYGLLAEGKISEAQFGKLRVQLDWLQYKQNFRDVVTAAGDGSFLDLRIDTRQIEGTDLKSCIQKAVANEPSDRLALENFCSFRKSVAWDYNRFYWSRLHEWEQATGKGYEQALPGGKSDGNVDDAIADSALEFWQLLNDMEGKNQLPQEIFTLEIGVGTGTRCGNFVRLFRDIDRDKGTSYYPKLRVLMGDYSLDTLDLSRPAVQEHISLCSFLALDAMNPLKTLSFLRHKLLYVHSTNMYDNLPTEEFVRRNGRLYLVETRLSLAREAACAIAHKYEIAYDKLRWTTERLREIGPSFLGEHERGMAFWMDVWQAARLEERLTAIEELRDDPFPEHLNARTLDEILENAPTDMRFHLSSGALQSFANTLPLLHPRGYLQVQDIFVKDFSEYRLGFYGPGKLDGSIVNWINGAVLKEVAERLGYNVRFVPYKYRKGSKTSILYTSPRD